MELDQYIQTWSKKLSISEDDIRKEYTGIMEQEKLLHPDIPEEDRKTRTLQRLAMTYKKQLRSPAIGFEGMIIAAGDSIDMVARTRATALMMFKENPQQAIANGVTDEEGVPLDTRAEWASGQANRAFGKPLPEHNYLRSVFGVAKKKNSEEDARFFSLNLNGDMANNNDIPMFRPISFRAVDKTDPTDGQSLYKLNSSVFTTFNEEESSEVPEVFDLINNYCGDLRIELSELDTYHDLNEKDYNRLVVVEGDVTSMVLEPTSVGSRRLVIDDSQENLDDLESPGTTCWVPGRINIDFAEQSRVIVLGRTGRGKKMVDGQQSEEPGDVMLNVFGLFAIPEYKIEPNVKEIIEGTEEPTKETPEGNVEADW